MTSLTSAARSGPEWALAGTLNRLSQAQRAAEADSRLKVADRRLLWLFTDGEARTLREVAEALGLEQSTVNRQVNAALDAGLLERTRPTRGSAHLLRATDAGLTAFDAAALQHLRMLGDALEEVPSSGRDTFVRHLARFVAGYQVAVETNAASTGEEEQGTPADR